MCSHGPLIFNAACLPDKVIYGRNAKCGVDTRVSRHLLKHSARTYCTPAFTSKHSLKLFRKQRISHLKTIQSIMSTLKKQGAKEKGIPKKCFVFFHVAVWSWFLLWSISKTMIPPGCLCHILHYINTDCISAVFFRTVSHRWRSTYSWTFNENSCLHRLQSGSFFTDGVWV